MSSHTPGPWTIAKQQTGLRLPVVLLAGKAAVTVQNVTHDLDECDANARLIAAAPELLEELRHTLRNVEAMLHMLPLAAPAVERQSLTTWAERNRVAIAKAEGQAAS